MCGLFCFGAAYGDTGDDLMMALAGKLVSGDAEDEPAEDIFRQAQEIAAQAYQLLVDGDWDRSEPQPALLVALPTEAEPVAAALVPCGGHHSLTPTEQTTLFSWAEFLAEPEERSSRGARRSGQSGPSLFNWALEREQEAGLGAAGG